LRITAAFISVRDGEFGQLEYLEREFEEAGHPMALTSSPTALPGTSL
jgi:hypothetical protein